MSLYAGSEGDLDASMVEIQTGAPMTGGSVYAFVQRGSDDKWLWADETWQATMPIGNDIPTMTHVAGGLWILTHTPDAIIDRYRISCMDSGNLCYPDNRVEDITSRPLDPTFGTGNTAVNHNTGGIDNLRYVDSQGNGIDNADVMAYLKADYDAGATSWSYVKDYTKTDVNGRFQWPMHLDSGSVYTIEFFKQGAYTTATAEVTI